MAEQSGGQSAPSKGSVLADLSGEVLPEFKELRAWGATLVSELKDLDDGLHDPDCECESCTMLMLPFGRMRSDGP